MPNRTPVFLALLACAACSHDVTSPLRGTVAVAIAGGGQRDTIDAYLNQALVLQVTGTSNISNRLLQIASITYDTTSAHPPCYILITIPNSDRDQLTCGLVQPTNSKGQLDVSIHFAGVATTHAGLIVTVLDSAGGAPAGAADTIHFTIEPGNAVGITASPKDSAMYVSGLTLHGFVHDRGNNPRSDAVTYTKLSGPVALSGSQVSATTFGRAAIMVSSGSWVDTTYLSIVPNGTITFASPSLNGIAILGLDGSNYHLLPLGNLSAAGTTWAPNGASIAFEDDPLAYHRISIIDTTGNSRTADTTALDATAFEYQARYSRDGQWLYFTRLSMTGNTYSQLWRVGANASAATRVPSTDPQSYYNYNASPSPDGSTLVYDGAPSGVPSTIRMVNVTTGAVTNTGVTGDAPRWAPQGQTIAFLNTPPFEPAGPLTVMQSDGSNIRSLTPNGYYQYDIDWSPDGQWLIAINAVTGNIDVVNATSGLTLPLAFTRFAVSVSWRQTPH
ncbi:MAG TPA: hypothetical protein VFA43_15300 [Gemmatimonadaceae bacterium]|nr:hypothetical protein [Gemmatimonadaceae bacterium]